MKKILLVTLAMIFCATCSFGAEFVPTKMVLTVPDEPIIYPFDGTDVDFTFDLSGTPAAIWIVIMTNLDTAELPIAVRNGYLGWHYVNKIDTTVYISSRNSKDPGLGQTISWNGYSDANDGGGKVGPGQYTYYLWGYDDKSPRTLVSNYAKVGFEWECNFTKIHHLGEDGLPMSQPKIMGALMYAYCDNIDEEPWTKQGTHYKWDIGSDPHDVSKLEWSHCSEYFDAPGWADLSYGAPVFDPTDFSTFYHVAISANNQITTPRKYTFVSDGEAILATDWGNWDNITWESHGTTGSSQNEIWFRTAIIFMLQVRLMYQLQYLNGMCCVSLITTPRKLLQKSRWVHSSTGRMIRLCGDFLTAGLRECGPILMAEESFSCTLKNSA